MPGNPTSLWVIIAVSMIFAHSRGISPMIFAGSQKRNFSASRSSARPCIGLAIYPVDRSHGRQALKSLDEAAKRIAAGSSVLIFPEGTRSADGTLQEFKTGAVLLAVKAGVPIVPSDSTVPTRSCQKASFFRAAAKWSSVSACRFPCINVKASDKQKLAQELHAAVAQLLEERHVRR